MHYVTKRRRFAAKAAPIICGGLLSIVCTAGSLAEEQSSAGKLLAQLDRIRLPARSFLADLRFVEFRQGKKERELMLRMYARKTASGFDSLFVCLAPSTDRNKLLLAKGEKLWFYDPKAERPVPVTPFQFRNHSFVLDALSSALSLDYSAELKSDEAIVDLARRPFATCVLQLTPRENRKSSTGTIRYWLDKQSYRPIKDDVASASGKILRTVYYGDFKNVLGESRPMKLIVINAIEGTVSEIKFSSFVYHDAPDAAFAESFLPQALSRL
jgi:outer membrane lipoprotein-sorting protein